jgi:hypothetical protein
METKVSLSRSGAYVTRRSAEPDESTLSHFISFSIKITIIYNTVPYHKDCLGLRKTEIN